MSFFFTELDDSLRPKGSRDPLGIELIWSRAGRRLVGNLTTVTAHLDNFIIALIGFHLCAEGREEGPDWDLFERFEQLTARARAARGLPGIIGIRKITASPTFPVPLGHDRQARILDDQRQAGLWGLYASALAATGLCDDKRRPTAAGAALAERFLAASPKESWRPALNPDIRSINEDQLHSAAGWVATVLAAPACRRALADALLRGGSGDASWQHETFAQARTFIKGRDSVPPARDFLARLTEHPSIVGDYARRLLRLDELMALASVTFDWLLGCHGRNEEEIEAQLRALAGWPFCPLPDFRQEIDDAEWHARTGRLQGFSSALASGNPLEATRLLFEHHAAIARQRGGAAWIYWEGKQIKVVMSTTPGTLPPADEISATAFGDWMRKRSYSFFLDSFLSILYQISPRQKDSA